MINDVNTLRSIEASLNEVLRSVQKLYPQSCESSPLPRGREQRYVYEMALQILKEREMPVLVGTIVGQIAATRIPPSSAHMKDTRRYTTHRALDGLLRDGRLFTRNGYVGTDVAALEALPRLLPEPRGADQKATLDVARGMLSAGPLPLDELSKRVAATRVKTEEKDRRFTNAKRALDSLIRDGFLYLKDEKVYLAEPAGTADVSPADFDAQLEEV